MWPFQTRRQSYYNGGNKYLGKVWSCPHIFPLTLANVSTNSVNSNTRVYRRICITCRAVNYLQSSKLLASSLQNLRALYKIAENSHYFAMHGRARKIHAVHPLRPHTLHHILLQLVAKMVEPGHHHLHHIVRQGVQGERTAVPIQRATQPPQQVVSKG